MTKGIYCYIDNKNDNIVYVGKDSHIDEGRRQRAHEQPHRYNEQQINRVIQGNPSRYRYEVLWEIDDCSDNHLNQMEMHFISEHKPMFNFTRGGDGVVGFKHSEKSRKKISEANKGKTPWNKGKTLPEKTKKKMSEANKSKTPWNKGKINVYSEETKKKIGESLSKVQNTTGFYRVSKQKKNSCKQGFIWVYKYQSKSTRKTISSVDLKKLEKKVRKEGLEWKIIDEERAQKSVDLNKGGIL